MPFDHSSVGPVSQLSHYLAGHFGGIKQALATAVAYGNETKREPAAQKIVCATKFQWRCTNVHYETYFQKCADFAALVRGTNLQAGKNAQDSSMDVDVAKKLLIGQLFFPAVCPENLLLKLPRSTGIYTVGNSHNRLPVLYVACTCRAANKIGFYGTLEPSKKHVFARVKMRRSTPRSIDPNFVTALSSVRCKVICTTGVRAKMWKTGWWRRIYRIASNEFASKL